MRFKSFKSFCLALKATFSLQKAVFRKKKVKSRDHNKGLLFLAKGKKALQESITSRIFKFKF